MANYLAKLFNFYTLGLLGKTGLGKKLGLGSDPGIFSSDSKDGILSSLVDKYTGAGLTGAEQEQNEWNAQQAEISYQRQIDFYRQFQSPDAMVKQYQDAGLNPALMYGKGASAASPISAPQASGSGGQSSGDLISTILSIVSMKEQVANWKAERDLKSSMSALNKANADLIGKQYQAFDEKWELEKRLQNSTIDNLDESTAYYISSRELNYANISKTDAETQWTKWQAELARMDADDRPELNRLLIELRKSQIALERAQAAVASGQSELYKQQLTEARESWEARKKEFFAKADEAFSRAGIAQKDLDHWEQGKSLEAISIMADTFSKFQSRGPFGITWTNPDAPTVKGLQNGSYFQDPIWNYGDFSMPVDNPSLYYGTSSPLKFKNFGKRKNLFYHN